MKKPEECVNMQEIRNETEETDKNIIGLPGMRFGHVRAATKF